MDSNAFDLTFTDKIVFEAKKVEDNEICFVLSSYFKKDMLNKQICIFLKNNSIFKLICYSYEFGNFTWESNKGIINSEKWEIEEECIKSSVTKHFTVALSTKNDSFEYNLEKILPDVISNLLDSKLSEIISRLVTENQPHEYIDWLKILNNYQAKSIKYLQNRKQR